MLAKWPTGSFSFFNPFICCSELRLEALEHTYYARFKGDVYTNVECSPMLLLYLVTPSRRTGQLYICKASGIHGK